MTSTLSAQEAASPRAGARSLVSWVFTFFAGGLYSTLVLLCAGHHEAWADEAQCWLLARDTAVPELLIHRMRYEGAPPLWHMILIPFAKLGLPYTDLNFVSAAFGIIGVGLFLWLAPFPLWLRLVLPFTYFPLYQFSVIARNYVLILPLICGIATLYPQRIHRRPKIYFLLLALLANVSLHGAIFAGFLFLEWFWSVRKVRSFGKQYWFIAAGAVSLYVLLFLQLFPAGDHVYNPAMHPTLQFGISRASTQISEAFFGGLGSSAYFRTSFFCASVVIGASAVWLRKTSLLFVFLGASTALVLLAGLRYGNYWHSGVLFLIWIFVLWVSAEQRPAAFASAKWLHLVIGAVFVSQAFFGLNSVWFDVHNVYSGSRAAAAYLKATGEDRKTLYAWGYKAFGIQPYFHRNLFSQQEHGFTESFYPWKNSFDVDRIPDVARDRPDRVILTIEQPDQFNRVAMLHARGYCEERRFDGKVWWKNGGVEPDIYVVMAPCIRGTR